MGKGWMLILKCKYGRRTGRKLIYPNCRLLWQVGRQKQAGLIQLTVTGSTEEKYRLKNCVSSNVLFTVILCTSISVSIFVVTETLTLAIYWLNIFDLFIVCIVQEIWDTTYFDMGVFCDTWLPFYIWCGSFLIIETWISSSREKSARCFSGKRKIFRVHERLGLV